MELLYLAAAVAQDWQARLNAAWMQAAIAQAFVALRSPEAATTILPAKKTVGSVAVVSLSGFMSQKPTLFSMLFGGTSTEGFAREVVGAMRDPKIGAVVMNVDSPGGSVHGLQEAAAAIRAARGGKPLVAVANPMAGSAAYYMASQADPGAVYVTPSGVVGSVGAMVEHLDYSEALAKSGIKLTIIKYGENKGEGHPGQALSEGAISHTQAIVNAFGQQFEADVAKGRGVTEARVHKDYGQGATFHATAAKAAGLVDEIASLDTVLEQLSGRKVAGMVVAEDVPLQVVARRSELEVL